MSDLRALLNRFLGEARAEQVFEDFGRNHAPDPGAALPSTASKTAQADLLNFAENQLAGAIGAASARMALDSIATDEHIVIEDLMRALEQTREAVERSREMEAKNAELEALAEQLSEANAQLKQLDRLKADFVTTVTHELRTPVTSIKSLSKILLDNRGALGEEREQRFLEILTSESDRIGRLINQVLDIEKLEAEAISGAAFRREAVDLAAVVRRAGDGMAQLFEEKNLAFAFATNGPVEVWADRDRLVQVVVNLLSNAQKFAHSSVEAALWAENGFAALAVRDDGPGIPPDKLALIFERFTQLNSPSEGKPTGTGLGLFISKKIAELHGAEIWAESDGQRGTAFLVRWPLAS